MEIVADKPLFWEEKKEKEEDVEEGVEVLIEKTKFLLGQLKEGGD